jgi:15-hydroxyprostaglandin dehydrogenase (NAD)
MSIPVGIVSGASSGIGLAVTKHLLSRGYRVVIADVIASEGEKISAKLGKNTLFLKTDVTVYAGQYSSERLLHGVVIDLVFLLPTPALMIARGLYEVDPPENEDGTPKELNLKTIRVDLDAVFQEI